jgi:hypothetical protein
VYISGDVSLGGTLAATSGTVSNTYKNLYGKAVPTSVYGNLVVSPNTTNATSGSWVNNNITWTATASSFAPEINSNTYFPFNSNITSGNIWTSSNKYAITTPYGSSSGASTYVNSIGTLSGEWIQIQSSVPVIINSYQVAAGSNILRSPYNFSIIGSNDGNNWYPIQNVQTPIATNPYTATFSYPSTNSLILANNQYAATTYGASTITTTTYSNYTTQSYTYFRLVILNIYSGGTQAWVDIAEWPINFSVPTVTGPSRALLYMDASNINQLDVSGSLALVNSNASTMIVSPNTGQYILSTTTNGYLNMWNNNNITWNSSASSLYANTVWAWNAFMPASSSTNSFGWAPGNGSSTGYYNATTGAYQTASTSTTVSGSGKSGEWLQLQSSIPLILTSYYLQPSVQGTTNWNSRIPATYTIAGSNDGTTWYGIQDASFTSTPIPNSNTTIVNTVTYTIPTSTTAATQTNNSIKGYGTSSSASYTYFRFITGSMMGTRFGASVTDTALNVNWFPFFSPATSAVSMALDNAVLNQLNVGGAMNVAGTLGIAGGITPTYSTPSFGPGQVGYIILNTISASSTSTTRFTLSTILITPGIWILSASIAISAGTGGQTAITVGSDFSYPYIAIAYNSAYSYPSITGVTTVSTNTTINLLYGPNVATSTTYTGPFSAIRIA